MVHPRIVDSAIPAREDCSTVSADRAAGMTRSEHGAVHGPHSLVPQVGFSTATRSLSRIGKRLAKLTPAALLLSAGQAAFAGGYAVPIIEVMAAPTPVAATPMAGPSEYWLALIPLAILFLASRGGNGSSSGGVPPTGVPLDQGGICFGEGTLLQMEDGWRRVEDIRVGERIVSSKGIQTVLSVDFWTPTEFRHRPCEIEGVSLSTNHGVRQGEYRVPAQEVSLRRERINGLKYFHILLENHSWLYAKATPEGTVVEAESLWLTKDLALSQRFPELVARHAADPAAPNRAATLQQAAA